MGFFIKLALFIEAILLFIVVVGYFGSFVVLPGGDAEQAVDRITLNLEKQGDDPIAHVASLERRAFSSALKLSLFPAGIVFVGFIVFIWNTRLAQTNPLRESRLAAQANFTASRNPSPTSSAPVYHLDPEKYSGDINTSIDALSGKRPR